MDSYYKTFISRLILHDLYYMIYIAKLMLQDLYYMIYIAKSILQLVTKADSKLTQWKPLSVI